MSQDEGVHRPVNISVLGACGREGKQSQDEGGQSPVNMSFSGACGRDGKQPQEEGGHSLRARTRGEGEGHISLDIYLFQAPVDEKETGPKTREARAFMPGDSCFRPASVSPSTFHPANTSARACACALGLDEKGRRGDRVGWGGGRGLDKRERG